MIDSSRRIHLERVSWCPDDPRFVFVLAGEFTAELTFEEQREWALLCQGLPAFRILAAVTLDIERATRGHPVSNPILYYTPSDSMALVNKRADLMTDVHRAAADWYSTVLERRRKKEEAARDSDDPGRAEERKAIDEHRSAEV